MADLPSVKAGAKYVAGSFNNLKCFDEDLTPLDVVSSHSLSLRVIYIKNVLM